MRRLAFAILLALPLPAAAQEVLASYAAIIGVEMSTTRGGGG